MSTSQTKTESQKNIKVLIMSVGKYNTNSTAQYFNRIGGKVHCVVCLPKQYETNATSYQEQGFETFTYDEQKYINDNFEYFGFKKRNCGGVGRQGIAEAVEKYGSDSICFQVDDDYSSFSVCNDKGRQITIRHFEYLELFIRLFDDFYTQTHIEVAGRTGATPPDFKNKGVLSNHKIFNNFIMRKGNQLNFNGFAALCSDDVRYNIYNNLLNCTPMFSHNYFMMNFRQNQGDRRDGNAPLYNSDCSWKKAFCLKMIFPVITKLYISKEENRVLFREHIEPSKIFPPIFLEENGKLVARLKF